MNKSLLLYPVVLAIGAIAGSLITKRQLEQKYAKLAEEEISSVRDYYVRRDAEKTKEKAGYSKEASKVSDEELKNPHGVLTRSSLQDNPYEQAKRNYASMHMTHQEEPEGDPDEEEDDELRDPSGMTEQDHLDTRRVDRSHPYIIDDEEFANEFDYHEKVSLYYYRVDGSLMEENEELIPNPKDIIGEEALKLLDKTPNVWVRNESLGIDYEIIGLNTSYTEATTDLRINENLSPRERYQREQKLKEQNEG